jgi:DNA-binding response OmpR family regulator
MPPAMNPVRLLLVEDDAVSRGFLGLALESMPATVVDTAADAAHASALVREHAHALWLIDANLPDASGEQLLRDLRVLRPNVPALCLTAEVDLQRLDRLRAAGFIDVLPKPLAIATLQSAVRRALAANAPAPDTQPIWDDAQALRALGGNTATMNAMRALFVAELPLQSEAVLRALAVGDAESARAVLHRLKASCGFTGSARLLDAVRALSDTPHDPLCAQRFSDQVAATIAAAQPDHAQPGP